MFLSSSHCMQIFKGNKGGADTRGTGGAGGAGGGAGPAAAGTKAKYKSPFNRQQLKTAVKKIYHISDKVFGFDLYSSLKNFSKSPLS